MCFCQCTQVIAFYKNFQTSETRFLKLDVIDDYLDFLALFVTILNRFVLHTLQRDIMHLAVITRKTKIKLGILKGGTLEQSRLFPAYLLWISNHFK